MWIVDWHADWDDKREQEVFAFYGTQYHIVAFQRWVVKAIEISSPHWVMDDVRVVPRSESNLFIRQQTLFLSRLFHEPVNKWKHHTLGKAFKNKIIFDQNLTGILFMWQPYCLQTVVIRVLQNDFHTTKRTRFSMLL